MIQICKIVSQNGFKILCYAHCSFTIINVLIVNSHLLTQMGDAKELSDTIIRCELTSTTSTSSLSPYTNSIERDETAHNSKVTRTVSEKGSRKFFNLHFPIGSSVPATRDFLEEHNLMGIEERTMVEEGHPDFIKRSARRSLIAPSTREERQNDQYARKVGINL